MALFMLINHWVGCILYLIVEDKEDKETFFSTYSHYLHLGLIVMCGNNIDNVTTVSEQTYVLLVVYITQIVAASIFGNMAVLIE